MVNGQTRTSDAQTKAPTFTPAGEEDIRQQSIPSFTPIAGRGGGRGRIAPPTGPSVESASQRDARIAEEKARQEQVRVANVQRGIDRLQQRLELGRLGGRQTKLIQDEINTLRQSLVGALQSREKVVSGGQTLLPQLFTARPDEFEQRQIDIIKGIPQTAFFNIRTGKKATLKQQEQLNQQLLSELVIGDQPRLTLKDVEFSGPTRVTTQFKKDIITGELIPLGGPTVIDPKTGKTIPFTDKSISRLAEDRLNEFFSRSDKFIINNADLIPDSVENLALTKVPFSFTDQLKFLFFAPAISTAAAAKGVKAKVVVKPKPKGKTVTLQRVVRGFENEFTKGNVGGINQKLKDLSNVIQGQSNLAKKRIAIENLQKILKELDRKKIIKGFAIDEATGQFNINLLRITPKVEPPTITIDVSEVVSATGKLSRVGDVFGVTKFVSSSRQRNIERVNLAKEKNRIRIENAQKPIGERLSSADVPAILGGTKESEFTGLGLFERSESTLIGKLNTLSSKSPTQQFLRRSINIQTTNINQARLSNVNSAINRLNAQLQRNKLTQQSLTRQIQSPLLATNQLSKQLQLSKQTTLQKSLQKQLLRLRQIQRGIPKGRLKPRFRIPFKPIIPFFGRKKKVKPFVGKVRTKAEKKFDVFVRKKGKDIKIKSFKKSAKAQTFLRKRLSTTLRAGGFIFDKRLGRKIKPKVTTGFRLGKKDPFRLIEKRGRRLDTRREVRKIQEAKRAKKPFKPVKSKMKSTKLIKSRRKK